jgi:hypothetical protein
VCSGKRVGVGRRALSRRFGACCFYSCRRARTDIGLVDLVHCAHMTMVVGDTICVKLPPSESQRAKLMMPIWIRSQLIKCARNAFTRHTLSNVRATAFAVPRRNSRRQTKR